MITITSDGKTIGQISLQNGKLVTVGKLDDIMKTMRQFRNLKLTDEEIYRMIPFRLTGRTNAGVSGDDKDLLLDRSVYDAKIAEADAAYDARRAAKGK